MGKRYRQSQAEKSCAVWGSECIVFLHIGSVSPSFLPSVKLFKSPEKAYKENTLCTFCCSTDYLGLSLKIKEVDRTQSESAVPDCPI